MRNKFILILGFLCIATQIGWAAKDATSGMFFGGAAGTAAGAGIGYAIDRGPGGAILGAVIGGLLGSAVGRDACAPCSAPRSKPTCATTGYYYNAYPTEVYCYSSNRAALEQERRAKRAYERARYYELLAENERLRRELMLNDGCCTTEYHYTTIYR